MSFTTSTTLASATSSTDSHLPTSSVDPAFVGWASVGVQSDTTVCKLESLHFSILIAMK
jgi:hypothetical protein